MRGTQLWDAMQKRAEQDHPRLCGEHEDVAALTEDLVGSPPLMRGTRHL